MATRLIVLAGQAGSGKDTVGTYIATGLGGVTLGLADPLKRFASYVFGFSEDQLWGPSEMRNTRDPRYDNTDLCANASMLGSLDWRFEQFHMAWIDDILLGQGDALFWRACTMLARWMDDIVTRVRRGDGLTPRYVLQTLGCEFGRAVAEDVWIDYALWMADGLTNGPNTYDRTKGLRFAVRPTPIVVIPDVRFLNEINKIRAAGGVSVRIHRSNSKLGAAGAAAGVPGHQSEQELGTMPDNMFDYVIQNNGDLEGLYGQTDQVLSKISMELTLQDGYGRTSTGQK